MPIAFLRNPSIVFIILAMSQVGCDSPGKKQDQQENGTAPRATPMPPNAPGTTLPSPTPVAKEAALPGQEPLPSSTPEMSPMGDSSVGTTSIEQTNLPQGNGSPAPSPAPSPGQIRLFDGRGAYGGIAHRTHLRS